jgi:hypothetical protein
MGLILKLVLRALSALAAALAPGVALVPQVRKEDVRGLIGSKSGIREAHQGFGRLYTF